MATQNAVPAAEVAELLSGSGLLFQINRLVLHPFGLALAVEVPTEPGEEPTGKMSLLRTDDPEGFEFTEASLEECRKKLEAFAGGKAWQLRLRELSLGFPGGVQPLNEAREAKDRYILTTGFGPLPS